MLSLKVFVVIAVLAGVLWLSRKVRLGSLAKVNIDQNEAEALGAQLLDFIKFKSHEPGLVVDVRPFWRQRELSEADKYAVMAPLFQSEVLLIPRGTDFASGLIYALEDHVFFPLHKSVHPQHEGMASNGEWRRVLDDDHCRVG